MTKEDVIYSLHPLMSRWMSMGSSPEREYADTFQQWSQERFFSDSGLQWLGCGVDLDLAKVLRFRQITPDMYRHWLIVHAVDITSATVRSLHNLAVWNVCHTTSLKGRTLDGWGRCGVPLDHIPTWSDLCIPPGKAAALYRNGTAFPPSLAP